MRTVLVALGLLVGCEARLALGSTCARSGECSSPLVCSGGRCRAECIDHRDCALGARCLRGLDGAGVCTLGGDSCDDAHPCEEGLRCSAGECWDPCLGSSCPAGGACHAGLCVRPSDGADAGLSLLEPHRGCASDDDCRPDEACVRLGDGGFFCRRWCSEPGECALGDTTSLCVDVLHGASNGYTCSVPCDPIAQWGCPLGEACDAFEAIDPVRAIADVVECRPIAAMRVHGEPCDSGIADLTLCAPGYSCDGYVDPPICRQLCVTDGSGPPCPTGTACNRDGWFVQVAGRALGHCI